MTSVAFWRAIYGSVLKPPEDIETHVLELNAITQRYLRGMNLNSIAVSWATGRWC